MRLRLLSVVAAAAAFAFVAPSPDARAAAAKMPISAKSETVSIVTDVRSRRHYRSHRGYRGTHRAYRHVYRHRGHRHSRRWRGPRFGIYAGPAIYGSYRRGYRGCGWLRQRAIYSGSRYWWRRYNACRYGW